jgi:hypothetical protein
MEDKQSNTNFDLSKEISLLLRSRYSLICLKTNEEERADRCGGTVYGLFR